MRRVQVRLEQVSGGVQFEPDGVFGAGTRNAVLQFQEEEERVLSG